MPSILCTDSNIGEALNIEVENGSTTETVDNYDDVLRTFAEQHNIGKRQLQRDECDDLIIQGNAGHLYAYNAARIGICLECGSTKGWNAARQKLEAADFRVTQDAEQEGAAIFDPANKEQVRLALKLAGVREKRKLSPELAERLQRMRFKARKSLVEGHLAAGVSTQP